MQYLIPVSIVISIHPTDGQLSVFCQETSYCSIDAEPTNNCNRFTDECPPCVYPVEGGFDCYAPVASGLCPLGTTHGNCINENDNKATVAPPSSIVFPGAEASSTEVPSSATEAPTTAPTPSASSTESDDDSDLDPIWFYIIGGFFAFMLIVCIATLCSNRKKKPIEDKHPRSSTRTSQIDVQSVMWGSGTDEFSSDLSSMYSKRDTDVSELNDNAYSSPISHYYGSEVNSEFDSLYSDSEYNKSEYSNSEHHNSSVLSANEFGSDFSNSEYAQSDAVYSEYEDTNLESIHTDGSALSEKSRASDWTISNDTTNEDVSDFGSIASSESEGWEVTTTESVGQTQTRNWTHKTKLDFDDDEISL